MLVSATTRVPTVTSRLRRSIDKPEKLSVSVSIRLAAVRRSSARKRATSSRGSNGFGR